MLSKSPVIRLGEVNDSTRVALSKHADSRGLLSKFDLRTLGDCSVFGQPREVFWSYSKPNVIRGMHFIGNDYQGSKIISVIEGSLTDFVVDLRRNSPTFLNLAITPMSEGDHALLVPRGCAHGFATESGCTILYLQDHYFEQQEDLGFNIDDLPIDLPSSAIRSIRDAGLPSLSLLFQDPTDVPSW